MFFNSRDEMQEAAVEAVANNNYRGTVIAGVGSGKTLIGINTAKKYEAEKILIAVPTENLRENWLSECDKFNLNREKVSKIVCYKSLSKENLTDYDLVILDECFPADRFVQTSKGAMSICSITKRVKKGEQIMALSFNQEKQIFEYKKVLRGFSNGKKKLQQVKIGNSKIKCTPGHLFLTDTGYKKACDLTKDDYIVSFPNSYSVNKYKSSSDFKDFLVGSNLGDGHVAMVNKSPKLRRLLVIHGSSQEGYLKWKAGLFDRKVEKVLNNGYAKKTAYRFSTKCFHWDNWSIFEYMDNITWKSMAIMFMDDGYLQKKHDYYCLHSATGYGLEANRYLAKTLSKKFNIFGKITQDPRKKDCYYLRFIKKDSKKISENIAPFTHKSMRYKLLSEHRFMAGTYNWKIEAEKFELSRVFFSKELDKMEMVYDIEVEDNHNFVICSTMRKLGGKPAPMYVVHNCHRITELSAQPFYDAAYLPAIIGLTGTPPIDDFKNQFLEDIIPICFDFPLDQSVKSGFVADYRIILCPIDPDNTTKNIRAGSKQSGYFYITEKQNLDYIDQKIQKQRAYGNPKLLYFERSRTLGKLPSKIALARTLSDLIKDQRHMIFTNTKVAAESMCDDFYHSKTTDEKLNQFLNNEIDRISVVFAADEGLNVDQIDAGIITNYFSKTRSFIQRLGRILRRKDGKPAMMYCIYARGTSEERQLMDALNEFDQSKVTYL